MIFWILLCSKNLLLTHLSEVKHLIQQASSLRLSESYTLYHPFTSWFLLWERCWGQPQEPREPFYPGELLCLGFEVTLKGFLFCFVLSSEKQQSAILLIFWERKKFLPFHFRELLFSPSLLPPLWKFFTHLWLSSTFLPRKQLREN